VQVPPEVHLRLDEELQSQDRALDRSVQHIKVPEPEVLNVRGPFLTSPLAARGEVGEIKNGPLSLKTGSLERQEFVSTGPNFSP
jgi:hypothetical protein